MTVETCHYKDICPVESKTTGGIHVFGLLDPTVRTSRISNRCELPNLVDVIPIGFWLFSADSKSGHDGFNSGSGRQV